MTHSWKRYCSRRRRRSPRISAPPPNWAWVHRELRPNLTLALLWEEYRAGAPDGFGYSWFCDLYRGWAGRLKPTMRQTHVAGEKLFVDYAGGTGEVVDGRTGEIAPVQIFVAVLGASNFTYAEAVWSQKLPDWIEVPLPVTHHWIRLTLLLGR
jgi:transposase